MLSDIFIIVVLTIINGIYTGSELAILSLNKSKIRLKAEEGDKKSILIKHVLDNQDIFLPTVALSYTVIGTFVGAYSGMAFSDAIAHFLINIGIVGDNISQGTLENIVVLIITILLSYFSIIFGETIPKKLALNYSEKFAYLTIQPLIFTAKILRPVSYVLNMTSSIFIRFIPSSEKQAYATEEDIVMLIDESGEFGNIDENEKEMINNIFAFDDKIAEEIATHRTNIVSINVEDDFSHIVEIIKEDHSRIPVYEDNIDNIIGVVHVKDLMKHIINSPSEPLNIKNFLRDPYFVPSTKKLNELFREMQEHKIQFSIVIDEYGGTFGIVTMEDLIEEIMGSIFDEYDGEEEEDIKILDNKYIINGVASIENVNHELDISLPIEEYDTIGGFFVGHLGRIPLENEEIEDINIQGFNFKIAGWSDKRIKKLIATKIKEDTNIKDEKNKDARYKEKSKEEDIDIKEN
ncbi:MAG: hemolysin family protein [Defluviitaleaceae bacterium]|nr:hemolysin family protein [Defluviitaleaceae bacterium]